MDVQHFAFLYNKEEKDAAILKFRQTMTEVVERNQFSGLPVPL